MATERAFRRIENLFDVARFDFGYSDVRLWGHSVCGRHFPHGCRPGTIRFRRKTVLFWQPNGLGTFVVVSPLRVNNCCICGEMDPDVVRSCRSARNNFCWRRKSSRLLLLSLRLCLSSMREPDIAQRTLGMSHYRSLPVSVEQALQHICKVWTVLQKKKGHQGDHSDPTWKFSNWGKIDRARTS